MCVGDTVTDRPSGRGWRRYAPRIFLGAFAVVTALSSGAVCTPLARADPAPDLKDAVVSARSSQGCGPLRYDPIAEQAAAITNNATDDYLLHRARNAPVSDPMPILKDLGSSAEKAFMLQGSGNNDADAIKGAILEGYAAEVLSDCTYTDFGVSRLQNAESGYSLIVVVLTGM